MKKKCLALEKERREIYSGVQLWRELISSFPLHSKERLSPAWVKAARNQSCQPQSSSSLSLGNLLKKIWQLIHRHLQEKSEKPWFYLVFPGKEIKAQCACQRFTHKHTQAAHIAFAYRCVTLQLTRRKSRILSSSSHVVTNCSWQDRLWDNCLPPLCQWKRYSWSSLFKWRFIPFF